MNILVHPTINDETVNPLNRIMYSQLENAGCNVRFYGEQESEYRPDILHIHWPDHLISGDTYPNRIAELLANYKKYLRARKFLDEIQRLKNAGTKVVWTAHNVYPHQVGSKYLAKWFYPRYFNLLDGVIYLSQNAKSVLLDAHSGLDKVPGEVIPRGNFKPETKNMPTRQQARDSLGISHDKFVYLYFGWLRANKNAPLLAEEYIKANLPGSCLIIAGKERPDYASDKEVGDRVDEIAQTDENIIFDRRRLSDEELLTYLAACDVAVLPYKNVLNSAVLLMTLSCNRPAVLPTIGTLAEISTMIGDDWIQGYDGDISSAILKEAYQKFNNAKLVNTTPEFDEFEWKNVVSKTIAYFENISSTPVVSTS